MIRRRFLYYLSVLFVAGLAKVQPVFAAIKAASTSGHCGICDKVNVIVAGKQIKELDSCLVDLIIALNNTGWETISSCDGHGRTDGYIWCKNRLIILSKEIDEEAVKRRYYKDFELMAHYNDNWYKTECLGRP